MVMRVGVAVLTACACSLVHTTHAQPDVSPEIEAAIVSKRADVARIIHESVDGEMQGEAWARLAAFTDTVGNRLAGSPSMEMGIDYLLDFFEGEGFGTPTDERHCVNGVCLRYDAATPGQPDDVARQFHLTLAPIPD